MPQSSTKRIARNSLMLYLRMMLSMVVGFYTSRVVLQTLGVEDYGMYGLVGGIVSMFGFLNTSLSSATSQFITQEVGTGDSTKLNQIFNTSFQTHCLLAFLIVLFAESLGLWFLNNCLVIPDDRMIAANIVFQLSIVSAVISILQVPYCSMVIAHEQMDIFAWLEILNVTLKLVIVWLIQALPLDPVVSYGLLSLLVTFTIAIVYRLYCSRTFPVSSLSVQWHPLQFRKLITFSGWNLYADASVTFRQQGINFLINRFFGVVLNASCSVASMLQGAVWLFGHNVLAAFRPQIIKQYSAGNIAEMQLMLGLALQYTLFFAILVTVPAVISMPFLLRIWLVEVPQYSILFCQILLIDNLIGLVNHIITIGIYAQGKIQSFSMINGSLKLLCLPAIYLILLYCPHPVIPYLICLGLLPFVFGINLILLKHHIPHIQLSTLLGYIARPSVIAILAAIIIFPLYRLYGQGWLQFISTTIVYCTLLFVGCYIWMLDAPTRLWVKRRFVCLLK